MTTKNKRYEDKMRNKGLSKNTIWIPNHCIDEFKLMAKICCEDKDLIPSTVRSLSTGRMKGINT